MKVGLRQGCVMSPWLFNLFMDGGMKEVREKAAAVRKLIIHIALFNTILSLRQGTTSVIFIDISHLRATFHSN